MDNIILIGMPGSGKSTVGVLLAKALGYSFIDTDLLISRKAGKPLQNILDEDGLDRFLELEQEIGTGGSMVLSKSAMEHLKQLGKVVYIKVPFDEIKHRVTNITTRGIVFHKNETLKNVYEQRAPLYERYADLIVDISDGKPTIEQTVEKAAEMLRG